MSLDFDSIFIPVSERNWAPDPVTNRVITAISRVTTPVTHWFLAIYRGYSCIHNWIRGPARTKRKGFGTHGYETTPFQDMHPFAPVPVHCFVYGCHMSICVQVNITSPKLFSFSMFVLKQMSAWYPTGPASVDCELVKCGFGRIGNLMGISYKVSPY